MHATALTDNAINLLKRPKTSKYLFEVFQFFQKFKNGKSGGICRFGDPFKIQWAPKRDQKSTKWRKMNEKHRCATLSGPFQKTLKHVETPSGLNLRFSIWCFQVFFSNCGGTVFQNICCFYSVLRWRQINRETPNGSALRTPMAAKREAPKKREGRSVWRFWMYSVSPTLAE